MIAEPPAGRVLGELALPDVDAVFLLNLRGWLATPLRGHPPRLVREVAIVLGELMTNAYRHAGPPFAVRVTDTPRPAVRVEVHDGTTPPASGWSLGRGLLIVRDLCPVWGVAPRPAGKITWAEVPVPQTDV